MGLTSEPKEYNDFVVSLIILGYAFSSLGGVFVNKACLSGYHFAFPVTLLLFQLLFSVATVSILRLLGAIHIPHRPFRLVVCLLYPAVFFILNVTVGLCALRLVNIPMFSAFRRLSVIKVMMLEFVVLGKTSSRPVIQCVMFMVLGSLIAACGDLTFDPLGYALVFANNLLTAANLVSLKKASQVVNIGALGLFFYISLMSLPIVFAIAVATGELPYAVDSFRHQEGLQTPGFFFALAMSAASAFLVNYFTNLCTQVTSALTTSITGQSKNILQTLLGFFTWGYKGGALNVFGLAIALCASTCFAFIKYGEGQAAQSAVRQTRLWEGESKGDRPDTSLKSVGLQGREAELMATSRGDTSSSDDDGEFSSTSSRLLPGATTDTQSRLPAT